ncbi:hypothetical protein E4K10_40705 [Streptomyces sp. T1317-0309]|nr:hypothetical protein E4K10_40705 [Streptomyces sp. T1317-0309]
MLSLSVTTSAGAQPVRQTGSTAAAGVPAAPAAAQPRTVTLITGDKVTVTPAGDAGTMTVSGPHGEPVAAHTDKVGKDLYVYPESAAPYVSAGLLDKELFNVTGLVADGYDDARVNHLPLIVTYTHDATARAQAAPRGANRVRTLSSINGAALTEDHDKAAEFWSAVTAKVSASAVSRSSALLASPAPRPTLAAVSPRSGWRQGQGHARRFDRPDRCARGVARGQHRQGRGRRRTRHRRRRRTPRSGGPGRGGDQLRTGPAPRWRRRSSGPGDRRYGRRGPPRARHPCGLHHRRDRRGLRWQGEGRRPRRPAARRQGPQRLRRRTGFLDPGRYGVGRPGRPRQGHQHEPRRKPVRRVRPAQPGRQPTQRRDRRVVHHRRRQLGSGLEDGRRARRRGCALTVGAVDGDDRLADFSSRGPRWSDSAVKPEITAPGVDILAARSRYAGGTGDYTTMSGT